MDIIKKFNNENRDLEVRIMGDYIKPLFVARDIAKILDIKDINSTIRDFDNDQKGMHTVHTPGGDQNITILTEEGVYKLLFSSRKEIAKRFQKWVFNVIHELRINGKYEIQKQIEEIKSESSTKIKEIETKYKQLDSFMKRKHFSARDVIYLAKMHPSRTDDIYKFGRTTDETSRRKNYRGQRTEPIEIIDTLPVIDRKRAEGNLKYIVEPYIYSNTSEEIVQMPYNLLKLAADTAAYIDKIKLKISEEMKNYIAPDVPKDVIEPADDNLIKLMEEQTADIKIIMNEDEINDNIQSDEDTDNIDDTHEENTATPTMQVDIIKKFIEDNVVPAPGEKLTRRKLQECIKKVLGEELLSLNTQKIIVDLGFDKKITTMIGYKLRNNSLKYFVNNYCDFDPIYKIDSNTFIRLYTYNMGENAIKSSAQVFKELEAMGFQNTKHKNGRFIKGLLPKHGSLEIFIKSKCNEKESEISMEDFNKSYIDYCLANNLVAYKRPTLKARMEFLGYPTRNYNNGCINFIGIELN